MKIEKFAAVHLALRANEMSKSSMRFGQALWLLVTEDHEDLAQRHLATELDFFYEEDNQKVMEIFFEHYVENGNDQS